MRLHFLSSLTYMGSLVRYQMHLNGKPGECLSLLGLPSQSHRQGDGATDIFLKSWIKVLAGLFSPEAPLLGCRCCLLPVSSHGPSSEHEYLWGRGQSPSSSKDAGQNGQNGSRPTLMASFQPNCFFKGPTSKYNHILFTFFCFFLIFY